MPANRDVMSDKLVSVYGPSNSLADWEAQFWIAQGHEARGPGDKFSWYKAQGASGTHYGDVEYDYWTNVYSGGGGGATFRLMLEDGVSYLLAENGDFLRKE